MLPHLSMLKVIQSKVQQGLLETETARARVAVDNGGRGLIMGT